MSRRVITSRWRMPRHFGICWAEVNKFMADNPEEQEPTYFDAFNLDHQNLLPAKRTKVSLRRLRMAALVARKRAVLQAMAETANEDTLKTDTVEAIISAAWLQFRARTALDICLNVMALVCLCLTTYGCRAGSIDAQPAPQSPCQTMEQKSKHECVTL